MKASLFKKGKRKEKVTLTAVYKWVCPKCGIDFEEWFDDMEQVSCPSCQTVYEVTYTIGKGDNATCYTRQ